jgi:hypothetical protein
METVERVKQNIEAVVDATRKAGDEKLAVLQRVRAACAGSRALAVGCVSAQHPKRRRRAKNAAQLCRVQLSLLARVDAPDCLACAQEMARERKAREEAEAVLADTTRVRICTALAVPCAIVARLAAPLRTRGASR